MHMEIFVNGYFLRRREGVVGKECPTKKFGGGGKGGVETVSFLIRLIH